MRVPFIVKLAQDRSPAGRRRLRERQMGHFVAWFSDLAAGVDSPCWFNRRTASPWRSAKPLAGDRGRGPSAQRARTSRRPGFGPRPESKRSWLSAPSSCFGTVATTMARQAARAENRPPKTLRAFVTIMCALRRGSGRRDRVDCHNGCLRASVTRPRPARPDVGAFDSTLRRLASATDVGCHKEHRFSDGVSLQKPKWSQRRSKHMNVHLG